MPWERLLGEMVGSEQQQPSPEGSACLVELCRQAFGQPLPLGQETLPVTVSTWVVPGRGTVPAGLSRLGSLGVLVTTRAIGTENPQSLPGSQADSAGVRSWEVQH